MTGIFYPCLEAFKILSLVLMFCIFLVIGLGVEFLNSTGLKVRFINLEAYDLQLREIICPIGY